MNVVVAAGAKIDIAKSYTFYERQSEGWGSYFRKCIINDLFQLESTAGIHRIINGYHHVKSAGFNSILYYRMEPNQVVVVAILDGRMNPEKRDRILTRRP
jgi:hypothetical protein